MPGAIEDSAGEGSVGGGFEILLNLCGAVRAYYRVVAKAVVLAWDRAFARAALRAAFGILSFPELGSVVH